MGERFIKEGQGWRLGWDPAAIPYCGLLAGQGWAIELTQEEFQAFCRLALELRETMIAIAAELMSEERVSAEAEAEALWLEAEGVPEAYSLRFILNSGRRCEGMWEAESTQQLIQAIGHLTLF
ncbi:DUF1818 family protein [Leptolyngbya sp. KIOST-1]|uniref:DUF1818 family protein n=1 Tax=Leptolyngbya sp. KIOST-1 TaxID=1229172 RepID=UPI00055E3669|nr:DUF1818 family protein [Leptolyngbya sp. KIOST-1]